MAKANDLPLRVRGITVPSASAASFAVLVLFACSTPTLACRSSNVVASANIMPKSFQQTGADRYDINIEAYGSKSIFILEAPSADRGYCIELSTIGSPDVIGSAIGALFWGVPDEDNFYVISIVDGMYGVTHRLFNKQYELIPLTADASIKKGLNQKNEIDLWLTVTGVDIHINGVEVNKIVARPSTNAQLYGVSFAAPKQGAASFEIGSPRIVK